MNTVEPIRNLEKISQIKNLLRSEGRIRDLLLLTIGINSALRASDLLQLQVGQFLIDGTPSKRFWIREQKRGKRQEVVVNQSIQQAFCEYRQAYPDVEITANNFLFFNTRTNDYTKHISREQAWHVITNVCKAVGLSGNYGTHTLRKTWGYHARMNGVDLSLIMHKLNHNDLSYTKRYLGITDEELEEVVLRLNLLVVNSSNSIRIVLSEYLLSPAECLNTYFIELIKKPIILLRPRFIYIFPGIA